MMITNLITYKLGDKAITGVCVGIDENTITLRFPVKDSNEQVDEKLPLLGSELHLHSNRNLQAQSRLIECAMVPKPKEGEELPPVEDVINYAMYNPFFKVTIVKAF